MNPAPAALSIAPGFTMPADLVTQTCGIIARKGAGKTHTGVVMAEELLSVGVQVVVIDPLGVWWGLRSSRDGEAKGFPIIVFGGDHGDLPLSENMGAQLADIIVDRLVSVVLDLSELSKSACKRFAVAFFERLYENKHPEAKRTPVHMFVDEADMFAPQRVQPDDARMLGAIDTIVRRGRVRGIGETLITQRPATINKDVLTQVELLISLQLTSPQDRKAVDEWIQANATDEERSKFMASLASMQRGQAWVWSPQWLQCFRCVQIRQRKTFDSSRTPTAGERPITPKQLAPVDLEALREQMAEALAKAAANDPEVLRKELAALKKEMRKQAADHVEALKVASVSQDRSAGDVSKQIAAAVTGRDAQWRAAVSRALASMQVTIDLPAYVPAYVAPEPAPAERVAHIAPVRPRPDPAGHMVPPPQMQKGERAILTALAQADRPRSVSWIAIRTGYAQNGGGFRNYLGALRSRGLIEGRADEVSITTDGLKTLGRYTPLPTGDALVAHWQANAGGRCEGLIVEVVARNYPKALTVDDVATATGYEANGGGFRNALGRLRTLGLITGRGEVRATADLMGDE